MGELITLVTWEFFCQNCVVVFIQMAELEVSKGFSNVFFCEYCDVLDVYFWIIMRGVHSEMFVVCSVFDC